MTRYFDCHNFCGVLCEWCDWFIHWRELARKCCSRLFDWHILTASSVIGHSGRADVTPNRRQCNGSCSGEWQWWRFEKIYRSAFSCYSCGVLWKKTMVRMLSEDCFERRRNSWYYRSALDICSAWGSRNTTRKNLQCRSRGVEGLHVFTTFFEWSHRSQRGKSFRCLASGYKNLSSTWIENSLSADLFPTIVKRRRKVSGFISIQ